MRTLAVILAAMLSIVGAASSFAQQARGGPGSAAPVLKDIEVPPEEMRAMTARFELALKGRVTLPLLDDLYGLPVERRIAWLRMKVEEGRSALFQYHLARNLWIMSGVRERKLERRNGAGRPAEAALGDETDQAPDPVSQELKSEAVKQALLAYVAMRVNALICRDPSSPDSYLHQLGNDLQPMLAYMEGLEPRARAAIVDDTLRRETRLGLLSRGDDLLCRRGIFGDRYCAPDAPAGSCPEGAAPNGEFMPEEVVQPHRLTQRRKARAEIGALAR
jgi:hypothetical protein